MNIVFFKLLSFIDYVELDDQVHHSMLLIVSRLLSDIKYLYRDITSFFFSFDAIQTSKNDGNWEADSTEGPYLGCNPTEAERQHSARSIDAGALIGTSTSAQLC